MSRISNCALALLLHQSTPRRRQPQPALHRHCPTDCHRRNLTNAVPEHGCRHDAPRSGHGGDRGGPSGCSGTTENALQVALEQISRGALVERPHTLARADEFVAQLMGRRLEPLDVTS